MIFILHYILSVGAMPGATVFISIYLQTYSGASMSEIGTLLMALPFLSLVLKPLVGGLADRHQAHKLYLMGLLLGMGLGFGSLTLVPLFGPHLIKEQPRLVWLSQVAGVLVGSGCLNTLWSLGDAMAVNGARMAGVSWNSWRVWALVSWAASGALLGQINDTPLLPRYVPGLLLCLLLTTCEVLLLAVWPDRYFVMYGSLEPANPARPPVPGGEESQEIVQKVAPKIESSDSRPDLQIALLKLIARRDRVFLGHFLLLAGIGFAVNLHLNYFYLNVERLSKRENSSGGGGESFAVLSTGMLAMHSLVETLFLLLLARFGRRVSRAKKVATAVGGYLAMQVYHATYLPHLSLYWAIGFEGLHGLMAAVVYVLINEFSQEAVERVDKYLPELVARQLVPKDVDLRHLKRSLPATLQGFMGAAMDGLGGGVSALVGGIMLDHLPFAALWQLDAAVCLLVLLAHSLSRAWRARSSTSVLPAADGQLASVKA